MDFIYKIDKQVRVKDFLFEVGYSRNIISKIKDNLFCNDVKIRLWEIMNINSVLKIVLPNETTNIIPKNGFFEIVYEDDYLMVINKLQGVYSMPYNKNHKDSLANYVLDYFYNKGLKITIHLVNRLDKDTQGLILVAKHQFIHSLIDHKKIIKKYYAVVEGIINNSGIIEAPIIKEDIGIKRQVSNLGKYAKTIYNPLLTKNNKTLLDILLVTGRTHQIRVHFAYINHPLIGDNLYGNGNQLLLQSYYLAFIHPITFKKLEFVMENVFKEML